VSARLRLSACVVALAVVLTQLPGPAEVLDVLTGAVAPPTATGTPLAAVESVLLITAGLLAWLLAAWAVVVFGVGLFARLPGRSGRRARWLLPRIAPASVGRLVLAAVGVSLIAGTAACAAPATAGPAAGPVATAETAGSAVTSTWSTPAPTGSFVIDWPDPSSTRVTTPAVPTAPTPAPAPASNPATTPSSSPAPATPSTVATTPPVAVAAPTPNPTAATPVPTPPSPTTPDSASPPSSTTQGSAATHSPAPSGSAATPTTAPIAAPTGGASSVDDPSAADPSPSVNGIVVMVQPGDSLWRIAAHSLGPNATDADVDNAWRAWYVVNREVIGDDPDVILPGQDLRAPGALGAPGDSAQVRP
jgi:hypothetical protein